MPVATVDLAEPAEVCFWTGAGVSWPAPSCIPLGDTFTELVLDHCCGKHVQQRLRARLEAVEFYDSGGSRKCLPRLEGVLHPLIEVLGRDIALAPLAMLDNRPPNQMHRLFAHHLRAGGQHLTVNLDRCIEVAYGADRPPEGLTHLHGVYARHELEELGVEMTRLARGLRTDRQEAIKRALGRRQLIFCGYSGRDYFDINPFFRLLRARGFSCTGLEVVWIEHCPEGPGLRHPWPPERAIRPILAQLRELGAEVRLVEAKTEDALVEAVSQWQFPKDDIEPGLEGGLPPLDLAKVDRCRRLVAEGHIYWYMGIGRDLVRLNRRLVLDPRRSSGCAREPLRTPRRTGYAATGRYRRALLHAYRSPRSSQAARAHRLAVLASTARLHGSFLLAGRWHAKALRMFNDVPVLTALEQQFRGDAIVEWLHWWAERHEQRGRHQGWYSDRVLPIARKLEQLWVEPFFDPVPLWSEVAGDVSYLALHPHSPAQLERLRERLPELEGCMLLPELAVRVDAQPSSYAESDSVAGYINSERRRIGAEACPEPADIERLARSSRTIQDRPGVLKAALLARRSGLPAWPPLWSLATVGWSYALKLRWCRCWIERKAWDAQRSP